MKAMIWKELRENFKWAVLAMIGLGLAEFYGLIQASDFNSDGSATLCKSAFLLSTTFGCAVVGFILGLVQILPEQRRDQWAALLHRPVSRATIFRGKAAAGLLLYLLATVPPFLACVWYVATPGHYAVPFVPEMVLPGIADIGAGTMYYFAAVLVGLRRGRWYGTRAFGFPAAVLISVIVVAVMYFWISFSFAIVMALALVTAGWGAILTNGALRDQPWPGRLALLTVVVFGTNFLIIVIVGLFVMFFGFNHGYSSFTQYEVDVDGRPLKITTCQSAGEVITDLAGNVIKDQRFNSGSRYNYLLRFNQVSTSIDQPASAKNTNPYDLAGYRNNVRYVRSAGGSYDTSTETWYYLPEQREFVGYRQKTKERIGAIGANGFRPGVEPVTPLAEYKSSGDGEIYAFIQFGATVYHNDFDQRRLTPIFSQPGAEIFGASPVYSTQDHALGANWGATALRDRMVILDKTGTIITTLPYHQDVARWGELSVAVTPAKDRFFIRYGPSQWLSNRIQGEMPTYLEEMDAKGAVLNTYTLPVVHPQQEPPSWAEYIEGNVVISIVPPAFALSVLGIQETAALCGNEESIRELRQDFDDNWEVTRTMAVHMAALSFVLAVLTLFWARQNHFSWKRAWAWAFFVLAFNLSGLITFRLVADWPVQIPCPQCGRKRPVEKDECPHCRAAWPVPPKSGIEIFDHPVAEAQTAQSVA